MGTAFLNAAAPLFSVSDVNHEWASNTTASYSYDPVTDSVLNSGGGWGNLKPEQIDQLLGSLAKTILKMQNDINVEELKDQARAFLSNVVDEDGNTLDDATITSMLEGPKGLFSGNPGSLNYPDPKTNMNRIQTLVASYGEKYQAALVEAYSGEKTQEQAKLILDKVSQEISAHIKENLVGNKDSPGALLSLLGDSAKDRQAQKNHKKDSEEIELTLSESPQEDDSQIA
jgi:hypothetical protein